MTIEQQVCTLEQAKRLKELGVNMPSLNYYYQFICNGETTYPAIPLSNWNGYKFEDDMSIGQALCGESKNEVYPAYTVAELGEMLPMQHSKKGKGNMYNLIASFRNEENHWYCHDDDCLLTHLCTMNFDTEAQARANALIYLLENNLHTL